MLGRRTALAALLGVLAAPALALPEPAAVRVRRRYVDGRFGQIHLREARPARAVKVPPLVLLHQSPLSGRMFDHLLPLLAADRVVIAVDTPGYGESDRPATRPSLAGYGDAILDALVRSYHAPIDLLGYHTGAAIAADLAARRPVAVRKLVLISLPFFDAARRQALLAQLETKTNYTDDGAYLAKQWTGSFGAKPPGQSLADVARLVAEKQRAGLYGEWALAAAMREDFAPILAVIRQPTLIIAPHDGLQDGNRAAAQVIPHARLVELPGQAYGLFDAVPDTVARPVLEFL